MSKFSILFVLSIILGFVSCKEEHAKKKVITETKQEKKKVEKKIEKKLLAPEDRQYIFDSISTENAVAFFTKYGKTHPQTRLKISTRLGDIYVRLYKDTPIHRASFLYLVDKGYYDTTCFYRIVPDFIVQGGSSDNLVTPAYKTQLHDYRIPSEFRKNRKHKRGCMAAARDWENNPTKESTPFEFYFIQASKDQSHLNYEHTVFGEITKGLNVIDKITQVSIDRYEWPEKDIPMKITILD